MGLSDVSTDAPLEYVRSLARGLAVIGSFSEGRPVMTISMVASETGLTRATARRILHTLCQLGFVSVDGDQFRLTPKRFACGRKNLSGIPNLRDDDRVSHPHADQHHGRSRARVHHGS